MAFNWRTIMTVRVAAEGGRPNGESRRRAPDDPCARHGVRQAGGGAEDRALSRRAAIRTASSKTVVTNADGRCDAPLLQGETSRPASTNWCSSPATIARPGVALPEPPFLDQVPIRFGIAEPAHYHVPLLVSPYGYSTYGAADMAKLKIRTEIRFLLNGEDVALTTSRPTRRCSTICGCAARCAAPRKAARRAIAAPARCWSGGWPAASCVYESVNACIRFVGSLDGCHVVTVEHLQRRRTARCIRCSRRWSTSTARNAASARRASSCRSMRLWMRAPEPSTRRSRRRCRAISAAAPATSRSCARRAPSRATARRRRTRWRPSARRSRRGWRRCDDGARVEIGDGRQRLIVPADVDDLAALLRGRAEARRSSPARPMSGSG